MIRNYLGMPGRVIIRMWNGSGKLVFFEQQDNLITTAGDEYYAKRSAAGVLPQANADVTKVTGMKLGTSNTTPTKSGAAAALGTYKTGSNASFLTGYPQLQDLAGDTGWNILYYAQWLPGVATDTALTEAVIVNDSASNATSTAANTISRVTFSPVNKTAADTLEISWAHTFLGA